MRDYTRKRRSASYIDLETAEQALRVILMAPQAYHAHGPSVVLEEIKRIAERALESIDGRRLEPATGTRKEK